MSEQHEEFITRTDEIAQAWVDKPHFLHAAGAKNTLQNTRAEALQIGEEIGRQKGRQELLAELALAGLVSINDIGETSDEFQGAFSFSEDKQLPFEPQSEDNVIPIRQNKPPRKLVFDDALSQSVDIAREEV